jgi:N-acetylglucosamine-6-phosphate deacetylase
MLVITGGEIITEGGVIHGGEVVVENGRIIRVGDSHDRRPRKGIRIDARGCYVGPGFIDLHVHGACGANFFSADRKAMERIVSAHARYGTTGLLATLHTAPLPALEKRLRALGEMCATGIPEGIRGIYLEGPFINRKRAGAQPAQHIRRPSRETLLELLDAAGGMLEIMVIAPEVRDGGEGLIALLKERGVTAAIGHSDATYEDALRSFRVGVSHVTHLFNAMSGLHHRDPGVAAAALAVTGPTVEIIADGVHVHPAMVKLAYALKGADSIVLVTDSMDALDYPGSEFRFGGRKVKRVNGALTLADGTICGSVLTMNRAVKNFCAFTGAPFYEAIKCAARNPARVLGIDDVKGTLAAGKDADIILFDAELEIKTTVRNGKILYNGMPDRTTEE